MEDKKSRMNIKAQKRWTEDVNKYDIQHLRLKQVASIINRLRPSSYFDLGCAKGTLRILTPGIEYIGCDFISQANLEFEFIQCDFNTQKLPLRIQDAELISCSGLLEYIEDCSGFLNQIYERIKPGSKFIVTYFNMNHMSRIFALLKGKSFQVHPDWRGFYSYKDIRSKLNSAGFSVDDV